MSLSENFILHVNQFVKQRHMMEFPLDYLQQLVTDFTVNRHMSKTIICMRLTLKVRLQRVSLLRRMSGF